MPIETKELEALRAILTGLLLGFEFVGFTCTSTSWFSLKFRKSGGVSEECIELSFSDTWWVGDRREWIADLEKSGIDECELKAQKLAGFALLQPTIANVELETSSVSIYLDNGGILTSICSDRRHDLMFINVSDCFGETSFEYGIPVGGTGAVWLAEEKIVKDEMVHHRFLQILQRGMICARSHAYAGEHLETHRYLAYIEAVPNILINCGEGSEQEVVDELERVNATWVLKMFKSCDQTLGLPKKSKVPFAKSVSIFLLELIGNAIKSSIERSETIEHQAAIAKLMDALEPIPFYLSAWSPQSKRSISSCLAIYPEYLAEFESLFVS